MLRDLHPFLPKGIAWCVSFLIGVQSFLALISDAVLDPVLTMVASTIQVRSRLRFMSVHAHILHFFGRCFSVFALVVVQVHSFVGFRVTIQSLWC